VKGSRKDLKSPAHKILIPSRRHGLVVMAATSLKHLSGMCAPSLLAEFKPKHPSIRPLQKTMLRRQKVPYDLLHCGSPWLDAVISKIGILKTSEFFACSWHSYGFSEKEKNARKTLPSRPGAGHPACQVPPPANGKNRPKNASQS